MKQIAFVGDYQPRKCGIATFTQDLRNAISGEYPEVDCFVAAVNDVKEGYDYPAEVRLEFDERDFKSYGRTAESLNLSNCDLVCLQHEFGIYGGPAGSHILAFLRDLAIPIVTTLHSVLKTPNSDQRRVMDDVIKLSSRLVVMSEHGRDFLRDVYDAPADRIDLVYHGIPDMPFADPNSFKGQFGLEGKYVGLTFGLLSPNKGLENVLKALPEIVREFPNFSYIILGETHLNLLREHGETYRLHLERLAQRLGVEDHVIFHNRFVDLAQLTDFMGAADLYITPYLNPAQITSGTLAYSFGCGKAVISTPYWHAEELLADGRGVLVPFNDPGAIAREAIFLLRDEPRRYAIRQRAYQLGREMIWPVVAREYMKSFERAREQGVGVSRVRAAMRTLGEQPVELPAVNLDHLRRMTDSTGMFQHATYSIPSFSEGYCVDDNARALLLTVMLEEAGAKEPCLAGLAETYIAFVAQAFNASNGRFRNFMSFDRRWLEEAGSDDSQGRTIWALGTCVGRSRHRSFQFLAAQLFEQALEFSTTSIAPRCWAFTLLGIHEYFRRLGGDAAIQDIRDRLSRNLVAAFHENSSDDWPWFENVLAYDNAKLPHALILAGRWGGNEEAFEVGLRALRWLVEVQRSEVGWFRPIGSNGFYVRGRERALFDQQPVDAQATTSACIEAFRATNDRFWLKEARSAFQWFLGRNDLDVEVHDWQTGGCRDGLHQDRPNENQGAESTLSFLLALVEMKLLDETLRAFGEPIESDRRGSSYFAKR